MGIKRVGLASLLLCACGPKAKPADGPGNTTAAEPLCIDPAQPGGQVMGPGEGDEAEQDWLASGNDQFAALEPGHDLMAIVEADGAQYAVVVTEGCYQGACDPRLQRAEGSQITGWAKLPFADTIPQSGDYPFVVTWFVVRGDAVWVGYNIVGEPEPAVGSTARNYLAVFGAADLLPRWGEEVSSYPEASSLDTCFGEVVQVDADCDGDDDLVQARTCIPMDCDPPESEIDYWTRPDGCPEAPAVSHTVYDRGADGAFAKR